LLEGTSTQILRLSKSLRLDAHRITVSIPLPVPQPFIFVDTSATLVNIDDFSTLHRPAICTTVIQDHLGKMGVSPAKEYPKFLRSMQETFDLAVNDCNDKRGSFRGQIAKNTHPLIALNIFISSLLLTESEKVPFPDLHGSLIDLRRSDLRHMDRSNS
jgi:hypothetical protein